jgi:hypothetical protein
VLAAGSGPAAAAYGMRVEVIAGAPFLADYPDRVWATAGVASRAAASGHGDSGPKPTATCSEGVLPSDRPNQSAEPASNFHRMPPRNTMKRKSRPASPKFPRGQSETVCSSSAGVHSCLPRDGHVWVRARRHFLSAAAPIRGARANKAGRTLRTSSLSGRPYASATGCAARIITGRRRGCQRVGHGTRLREASFGNGASTGPWQGD